MRWSISFLRNTTLSALWEPIYSQENLQILNDKSMTYSLSFRCRHTFFAMSLESVGQTVSSQDCFSNILLKSMT